MSENTSPKVSIIVPVYNMEEYLNDALESILVQSYTNFEVLLVDDGSTDNSSDICDEFSHKDPRFHVFHIPNGGVSAARNYALDRISGEYVLFVDADDLIKPEYIEKMVSVALSTFSPIVVCRYMYGKEYTYEEFIRYLPSKSPNTVDIKLEQYRCTGDYRHDGICCVLYSAILIKKTRFLEDLFIGEDTLFFAYALKESGRLIFIDEFYYYYRFNEKSAMHSTYKKIYETEITAREKICELFYDQSDSFKNECESFLAVRCLKNYRRAKSVNYSNEHFLKEIHEKAKKRIKNVIRSTGYSNKLKLHFLFFCCLPDIYVKYINWREKGAY